jgi:hypothetical protein
MVAAVKTLLDCTLPEKILLAAAQLDAAGQATFSAEALIVAAWQQYPHAFGLKGYEEQFPDSNKVLWGIMGEKGLPRRGLLAKVGQKLYTLTRDGRQLVQRLQSGDDSPLPPPPPSRQPVLSRPHDLLLQALLASVIWQKHRNGRSNDWSFSEACRFWNLGDRQGRAVDAHLEQLTTDLAEIERRLATASAVLGNGQTVHAGDAGQLCAIHEQLLQRFSRHLNLLRSRADRA